MHNELVVVSYLLEHPKAVPIALDKTKAKFFEDKVIKGLFKLLVKSYHKKEYITYNVLDRMLRKKQYGKAVYAVYEKLLGVKGRKADEFLYAIREINKGYKKRLMIQGLTEISHEVIGDSVNSAHKSILELGRKIDSVKKDSDGLLVGREDGLKNVIEEYKQAEEEANDDGTNKNRIYTGFTFVDQITGGASPGELWIWGGYTGYGKTQFAKEVAYHNLMNGKNVVFISLEMSQQEMNLLFATRHSHKFKKGGLLYKQIRCGMLKKKDRDTYYETVKDLRFNDKYGKFIAWYPEFGCTIGSVRNKLETIALEMKIDAVIIDYIDLLQLDEKVYGEQRHAVTLKCQMMKDLARSFNNNKGVFIFSPHQISRKGATDAEKRGYHILADLAESAGVERNANLVGWCLRTEPLMNENKVRIGISKYRIGDINPRGTELMADFPHSLLAEVEDINDLSLLQE